MGVKGDRKLTVQSESAIEMIRWVCAIDSIQLYKQIPSTIVNPLDKVRVPAPSECSE